MQDSLAQIAERTWATRAIHDTVRAAVQDPAFRRSLKRSLGERMLVWLGEGLHRLAKLFEHLPSTRSIGLVVTALLVVFVLARTLMAARRNDAAGQGESARGRGITAHDPWRVAEDLIRERRYEEAAHQFYRGVLLALGQQERLRLDPSRTSGDYVRELRRRGSSSLPVFRDFARRFERAVYGHETVNATTIDELRTLSASFRPRGHAA